MTQPIRGREADKSEIHGMGKVQKNQDDTSLYNDSQNRYKDRYFTFYLAIATPSDKIHVSLLFIW